MITLQTPETYRFLRREGTLAIQWPRQEKLRVGLWLLYLLDFLNIYQLFWIEFQFGLHYFWRYWMACMKGGFGRRPYLFFVWWEQKCLAWCFARYSRRHNSSSFKIYITSNDICQDEDEPPRISTSYVRQMQLSSNMFGVALSSLLHVLHACSCGDLRSQCRGETRGGPWPLQSFDAQWCAGVDGLRRLTKAVDTCQTTLGHAGSQIDVDFFEGMSRERLILG